VSLACTRRWSQCWESLVLLPLEVRYWDVLECSALKSHFRFRIEAHLLVLDQRSSWLPLESR
jgi:hypothetical protein